MGGQGGMVIALGVAVVTNAFAYWNADKIVLRMYGAAAGRGKASGKFYRIVEDLAGRAGMPMGSSSQPNAFATGRSTVRRSPRPPACWSG